MFDGDVNIEHIKLGLKSESAKTTRRGEGMKLLYVWMDNYKDLIQNQAFRISDSYDISFDPETQKLSISKNESYIENFYGKNILDLTAIVGENGAGKTTIAAFLYRCCAGVHPCGQGGDETVKNSFQIIVYEKENAVTKKKELMIYYYLEDTLKVNVSKNFVTCTLINLANLEGEAFLKAEQQHDLTTVYFTNDFKINDVIENQGYTEYCYSDRHKSLCYTPMLSLNRASQRLRKHYGSEHGSGGNSSMIEQYAQNMTADFKTPYASELSYNYLVVAKKLSKTMTEFFPLNQEFEVRITEFGEYVKFETDFFHLNPFDQMVLFVRWHFYDPMSQFFCGNIWERMFLNIVCEIVLFTNLLKKGNEYIHFDILEQEKISPKREEAYWKILEQFPNQDMAECFRKMNTVDFGPITKFLSNVLEEERNIYDTIWLDQVRSFKENYEKICKIEIKPKNNSQSIPLMNLLAEHYHDVKQVYGRMMNVILQRISSGEMAMIQIFASLVSAAQKHTSNNILLIVDGIDAFLHPKWQQEILFYMTEWMNKSELFNDKKVQLIVATHSPIILSDLPRDKIIYLKKPFQVVAGDNRTFGANVWNLFYDSFFMTEGSIGKIAKEQIQWVIDQIDKKASLGENDFKRIRYVIDNIGDRLLREKLKTCFWDCY